MDIQRGSSISEVEDIPVKPFLIKPQPICEDGQENQLEAERFSQRNQLCQSNWLESESTGFSNRTQAHPVVACCDSTNSVEINMDFKDWEASVAPKSRVSSENVNMYGEWFESSSTNSLFTNQCLSHGGSDSNCVQDIPQYGSSVLPTRTDAVSSKNISPQFAPITPDKAKGVENRQISDMPNSTVDGRTNEARDIHENEVATTRIAASELHHDKEKSGLLKDPTQDDVAIPLHENHNPDKVVNHEIDLSKTPQQKQRRRKHRPKVVIEGKPKRTRKPVAPKPAGPKENPTGKRKYVRKNGLNKSTATPSAEVTIEASNSKTAEHVAKSCRRSLNFDFESEVRDEMPPSNHDSESQAQNYHTRARSKLTMQLGQMMEGMEEMIEVGIAYDLTHATNQALEGYVSMPERQAPGPSTPNKTDPPHEKLKDDAQKKCTGGKCQTVLSKETHDKQGNTVQIMTNTDIQLAPGSPDDSNCSSNECLTKREHARGLKREHSCTIDDGVNLTGAHCNSLQAYLMFQAREYTNNKNVGMHLPAIYKRKRTEKGLNSATSSTLSIATAAENSARQATVYPLNDACPSSCGISDAPFSSSAPHEVTAVKDAQNKQQTFECTERLKKKRSRGPTQLQDLASLIGVVEPKQLTTFPAKPTSGNMQGFETLHQLHTCMEALVADTRQTMGTKKRTKKNSSVSSGPPGYPDNALVLYNMRYQEQNALVLYRRDGTVIPFEGPFDPVKKRRPRAKVDLDEETNRVWKLLLENINSEGIDGTDEDKAKWWEEERRVFHGRAESFIARMHLVQGDRRFSQWKGSVVDSVVGVFLTQNVSDHLSSSAFMSLAARFPLGSKSNHRSCSEERRSILVKEPDICILDPEDTIKWHEERLNHPVCDRSSMTLNEMAYNEEKNFNRDESLGSSTDGVRSTDNSNCQLLDSSGNGLETSNELAMDRYTTQITQAEASFMGDQTEIDDVLSSQNSVVSSQNSVDSSNAQRPYLQSNSEADLTAGPKFKSFSGSTFMELLQMAGTTMLHGVYDHVSGNVLSNEKDEHNQAESMECGVLEVECFDILREESRFSNIPKNKEENCVSEQSGLTVESVGQATVQKTNTVSFQEAPISSSENSHLCNSLQVEVNKIIQTQSRSVGDPTDNIELQRQEHNCMQQVLEVPNFSGETLDVTGSTNIIVNRKNTEQKAVESNLNGHGYLPGKTINQINVDSPTTKRQRMGKEEQNEVDWDNLRKQAQANGKVRERTANTMDSLDWEAVRCADVNDIAYTIRERGMNNRLAERIKDFLNRLVTEHGSIDLEWLRDVPPDKAKEYLLSVRGLGLKSVECVRLLTLHHLAFPVDTNVGRIAVRLGWVPLQPLPESLQLHLLELYPVLESIQKYLWPRLCKLDQRTLYELHYQMITFGKVFCTKNKPNCNACPMRGECRHFASAFASARLALPGPEEKSIVSATGNKAANQNPMGIVNPLQPRLPQANQQSETQSEINNCEPIIEVPATPEPIIEVPATPEPKCTQISESDIEDFYEDSDEIPTIKLNIEEFTRNLQNYVQQNMELQEGNMSKALVALTPEAASIPVPKLKNVSRLRTEHQVYELPDSHPLLERLDKREPDDPCSYLLAIWTPGETASSIQAPERTCSSQESGRLCDEKTCFSCNSIREANSQTVRGTLLIPCQTAMRGSFPLNGTYFQVNEVFADHDSSINPIDVPRAWIWNLPRRTVYFGTSIPTIFKGLTTEGIQYCFWRGFVCVRGFDQKTRAPRPLMARLHFPASKLTRTKGKTDDK
ncbi:hypothetical protein F0562_016826 [Nyssa sinensis]|uniref:HhH-GPD domain-containing protein n=1 Tax=Nyssa sinensis TaxID=561372 RepID=A0A5J4ZGQ0_9ASTE|nr:hypothetical protein F0562_016826 [Nyssa sinensis]